MPAKATVRAAHPLDDPETVRQVLAGLDRAVAKLRSVRVTLEHSKQAESAAEGRHHDDCD
jgi:hypothetical protein